MIEKTLNRILSLNPHYLLYLQDMAGLAVAIEFNDLPLKWTLRFHHSFVEVQSGLYHADLQLSATSLDFLIFATKKTERQKILQQERVVFVGDLHILEKLEQFLNHFQFAWLRFIPLKQLQQFLRNQVEYWQEEKQMLASPILFDDLKDEMLSVQQELDQCAAHLQALEACES